MAAPEELLLLLDRRLAALRRARPDFDDVLDLQEQLIRQSLTSARPAQAQPFPLPRDQVAARIRGGVPLLHDQPASVDIHLPPISSADWSTSSSSARIPSCTRASTRWSARRPAVDWIPSDCSAKRLFNTASTSPSSPCRPTSTRTCSRPSPRKRSRR